MKQLLLASVLLSQLASPVVADALMSASETNSAAPLTGPEFDAYVTGKTLTFADQGTPYGAEQYLPGNKVRWAFDQDTCKEGIWYQKEQDICFVYEDGTPEQCWQFFVEEDKLRAVFQGAGGTELYEAFASDGPLACMAPSLGV